MNILALDLATKTGWAAAIDGKHYESGVQDFSLKRGDSQGMRFLRFNTWLGEAVSNVKPGLVVYEQPHHRGGAATEVAVGLSTRVQELCAKCGIEHTAIAASTLKKYAVGHGKASKEQMVEAAKRKFPGVDIINDDHADALHLLDYALREVLWNA